MKKMMLCLATFLTVSIVSCQEKDDKVPDAVRATFQEKYPGENDPDWELDDHGNWESHFKINGEKYRADFKPDGTWVETENDIKEENLPEAIKKIIKAKFLDEEITEVERVDNAEKGLFYDVEFKKDGKNKDVMFREDGTVINKK
jgi:hypothetical protein